MADPRVVSDPEPPGEGEPVAPPSPAALGPDGAKARIAEIMADKTHPYWKGDKAAVDAMAALHATVTGEPPPVSSASYTVAVPPGETAETFDPIVQSIASAGTRAFGLSEPVANQVIAWMLDARHPEPALPTGQVIPAPAVAESRLQERWGAHFPRQMALAEAALVRLDEQRGGPAGALQKKFKATGANNLPEVIQELANLGGMFHGTRDPEFRELVEQFEQHYRQRGRSGRGP